MFIIRKTFFFKNPKKPHAMSAGCTHLLYDKGKANAVLSEYNSDFFKC